MFSRRIASRSLVHSCAQRRRSRCLSGGWSGVRGHDITGESLLWGERPKVILEAMAPTGFDVQNAVKKMSEGETSNGEVHMNGSILVFPFGCFMWNVKTGSDVTVDSLAPIILHRPKLDYLFIGLNLDDDSPGISLAEMKRIQDAFDNYGIVVEQMGLSDAIGTFNILNAEDRQVAAALIMDPSEADEED